MLMKRIGITNPWGSNGEGIVYYAHAKATVAFLDPLFLSDAGYDVIDKLLTLLEAMPPPAT